jgi:hypothetical protein
LQEEDSGSSTVSVNMSRAPVQGHISSLRAVEQDQKKVLLKDASKKHIDPFTGWFRLQIYFVQLLRELFSIHQVPCKNKE